MVDSSKLLSPLWRLLCLVLLLGFIAACSQEEAAPTAAPTLPAPAVATLPPPSPAPSPTPLPSPTPALAALVNGEQLLLATFEEELSRYEQASLEAGVAPDAGGNDYQTTVLEALIEKMLLAQAAAEMGIVVSPEAVAARATELRQMADEAGDFEEWLQANLWTEEQFRQVLAEELVAQQLIAQVTADVPQAVEQVRARYLQVDDAALAQNILDQVSGGADFGELARQNSLDQLTAPAGGDLGFFPRDTLLVPEVEAAAFALAPGETSEVLAVTDADSGQTTYYLVQTLEVESNRPLTDDMRYQLLSERFDTWLAEQWAQATIERFVGSGS